MADGTGIPTGRVGSCHIHLKPNQFILIGFFYTPDFEEVIEDRVEFRTPQNQIRSTKIQLRSIKVQLRSIKIQLQNTKIAFRSTIIELRSAGVEFRNTGIELRRIKVELRTPKNQLRSSKVELRRIKVELQSTIIELRSAKIELRSFFQILLIYCFCLHSRSRKKRDNRSAATFSPLKKFASHFFNSNCVGTGEKEAANPVTGNEQHDY